MDASSTAFALESAASLLELLELLASDDLAPARRRLDLGPRSTVLVINTEGATDPEHYARVFANNDVGGS